MKLHFCKKNSTLSLKMKNGKGLFNKMKTNGSNIFNSWKIKSNPSHNWLMPKTKQRGTSAKHFNKW